MPTNDPEPTTDPWAIILRAIKDDASTARLCANLDGLRLAIDTELATERQPSTAQLAEKDKEIDRLRRLVLDAAVSRVIPSAEAADARARSAQLAELAAHVHALFPMDSQLPTAGHEASFIIHTTNHLADSRKAAEADVASLTQRLAEEVSARKLVADILAERADDLVDGACDHCAHCSHMVMCSYHSVLSALTRGAWTDGAIERDNLRRQLTAQDAEIAQDRAVLEAVHAALDHEPVSDFMESFPLVRQVLDLQASLDQQLKISGDYWQVIETQRQELVKLRAEIACYSNGK